MSLLMTIHTDLPQRRFSEGMEQLPDLAASARQGSFADGLAKPAVMRMGSFADGQALHPAAHRIGSFGDTQPPVRRARRPRVGVARRTARPQTA
jgi:hypothetical protein